jgi:hypothetical protein
VFFVRFSIVFSTAVTILAGAVSAHGQSTDDSLRIYATDIQGLSGVYLGRGLILTAANVVGSVGARLSVRLGGLELVAKVIKAGAYDNVDLALLWADPRKLPINLQMRRLELCGKPPWVGEMVITLEPESTARSTVVSPMLLPSEYRTKFSTLISDIGSAGNLGSAVFDAGRKCLLGILSRKIQASPKKGESGPRDLKYFVPASTILKFIPNWYRS